MDRDFVLAWQPVTGSEPTAALFNEGSRGRYYGLLLVMPPAIEKAPAPLPRNRLRGDVRLHGRGGAPDSKQPGAGATGTAPRGLFQYHQFKFQSASTRTCGFCRSAPAAGTGFRQTPQTDGARKCCRRCAIPMPLAVSCRRDNRPLRQVIFMTDGAVSNNWRYSGDQRQAGGQSPVYRGHRLGSQQLVYARSGPLWPRQPISTSPRRGRDQMAVLFEQLAYPAAIDLQLDRCRWRRSRNVFLTSTGAGLLRSP